MKKLMVMLAGAAIAVSANAVQFSWSVQSPIFDGTGMNNAASGLSGYLFCDNYTSAPRGEGVDAPLTITRSALVAALESGVYGSVAEAWGALGYGLKGQTVNDETFTMGFTMVLPTTAGGEARGSLGGDVGNYYAVIVDGDNLFFTDLAQATVQTSDDTIVDFYNSYEASQKFIDAADLATGSNSGWVAMAVPEPTSGLLLLLGVAGLALRRRRA